MKCLSTFTYGGWAYGCTVTLTILWSQTFPQIWESWLKLLVMEVYQESRIPLHYGWRSSKYLQTASLGCVFLQESWGILYFLFFKLLERNCDSAPAGKLPGAQPKNWSVWPSVEIDVKFKNKYAFFYPNIVIGHGIGGKYIPIMARLAKARRWSKRRQTCLPSPDLTAIHNEW